MLSIKQKLARNYVNFRGWKTKRHIVVIESDDWGSIRMPSKEDYNYLLSKGVEVDKNYFDKNDSLESSEDLERLFEVLSSVKDRNGNHASITPMTIVANPNFDAINENGKTKYVYEKFTDTFKRFPNTSKTFEAIEEGISQGVFYPQFHGREHINVVKWMKAINSISTKEKLAFNARAVISGKMKNDNIVIPEYFSAFNYDDINELEEQKKILKDGLELFEEAFGYKSISFCPPCGIISTELNKTLYDNGVIGLQCGGQFVPLGNGAINRINHFWGDTNECGQIYWRRNCTFEPSRDSNNDCVNACLNDINVAFRWGKPAVINSHRVNYIGSIFVENRDVTLRLLGVLLKEILNRWPDVEFFNSKQLAEVILNDNR